MKSTIFLYPVISETKQQGQKKRKWWFFSPIILYRFVEDIQHLDGAVFTGRPRHIHSLDVRRVVEIDQFFGDLWIIRSGDGVFKRHSNKQRRFTRGAEKEHQRRHQTCCEPWLCVCVCLQCPCSWNPRLLQPLHRQIGSPKRRRTTNQRYLF